MEPIENSAFYLELLRAYLDSANDAIFVLCDEMKFLVCNRMTEEWLGESEDVLTSHNQRLPITRILGRPDSVALFVHNFQKAIKGESGRFECLIQPPKGDRRWVEFNINKVALEVGTMVMAVGRDITDRRKMDGQLDYISHHDVLTGLPNRLVLMDRLDQAITRCRSNSSLLGFLVLDLDRFKLINDSLGHDIGDRLLVKIARRLKKQIKASDTLARLSGDEFALLLNDIKGEEDVESVAHRITQALASSFSIEGHECFITGGIGISMFPKDGHDSAILFRNAETAMYQVKKDPGSSYGFYKDGGNGKVDDRLNLESQLRYAIAKEEFILHYQPQVNLDYKEITGVEALIRWQHPDRGLVEPFEFISVLEDTGMFAKVGEWVVNKACEDISKLCEKLARPITLSVNISGSHFADPRLADIIYSALERTGFPPRWLEIEITESTLLSYSDRAVDTLRSMREIGVQVAIDDFGTGYSSLSHLRHFSVDTLKIDHSFIRDLTVNSDDAAIVKAIISMAEGLDLKLIAEGVETNEQLEILKNFKCSYIQGFLFSKPLPLDELEKVMEKEVNL